MGRPDELQDRFGAGTDAVERWSPGFLPAEFQLVRALADPFGRAERLLVRVVETDQVLILTSAAADAATGELATGTDSYLFVDQCARLAGAPHPHILAPLAWGRLGPRCWYTADAAAARPLWEPAARGPLEVRRAVGIARAVAAALAHARRAGVRHRDLGLDAVLVDDTDGVWVRDFGIQRDLRALSGRAFSAAAALRAPERIVRPAADPTADSPADPDERAEVYEVGAILYTLVSGHPPFSARRPKDLVDAVLMRDPRPMPVTEDAAASAVGAVVMKALAREPAERQADLAGLIADLDAAEAGRACQASHSARSGRLARWLQRDRASAMLLAMMLAVVLASWAWPGPGVMREVAAWLAAAGELMPRPKVAATDVVGGRWFGPLLAAGAIGICLQAVVAARISGAPRWVLQAAVLAGACVAVVQVVTAAMGRATAAPSGILGAIGFAVLMGPGICVAIAARRPFPYATEPPPE